MDTRTARILVSAVFLLAFSVYNFVTYTSMTSHQSTFSLQPGLAYEIPATLNPSDSVSGTFQENSGSPVSLFVLSSAQFAAHQAKKPIQLSLLSHKRPFWELFLHSFSPRHILP